VIRRFLLILLILAGAGSACSSSVVVLSPTSYDGAYRPTVLNYAATSGGILVEVVGNPFDVPKADLESAITSAMTGSHFGQQVDFVTTPPEGFRASRPNRLSRRRICDHTLKTLHQVPEAMGPFRGPFALVRHRQG
jgi:hypothetical protein